MKSHFPVPVTRLAQLQNPGPVGAALTLDGQRVDDCILVTEPPNPFTDEVYLVFHQNLVYGCCRRPGHGYKCAFTLSVSEDPSDFNSDFIRDLRLLHPVCPLDER